MNERLVSELSAVRGEILEMQRRLLDLHQRLDDLQHELTIEQPDQRETLLQDLVKREPGLVMNAYPRELVEAFALDRRELPHLRCMAIEDYLNTIQHAPNLIEQLSQDPLPEVRTCVARAIAEHQLSVPEDTLMRLMSERTHDVMLNATRSAVKQVREGWVHPRVLMAVQTQQYFLVKDLAVHGIIDATVPDDEKLALLAHFTSASYFKTRRAILDFLDHLGPAVLCASPSRDAIVQLLELYLHDPKLSNTLRTRTQGILDAIQAAGV